MWLQPESGAAEDSLRADHQLRAAALQFVCGQTELQGCLWELAPGKWASLLRWLDMSGLSLYFLERLTTLQMTARVPPSVFARLEQNLRDNTERTRLLVDELREIHHAFEEADLSYAVMKGFSLWPHSVPDPCYRSQLDLDFLIAEKGAEQARKILEGKGYYLHAVSGGTWEFKTHHLPGNSLKDLYKSAPARCVELHLESQGAGRSSLLARRCTTEFRGIRMPVLSPVDAFLGQGLHLYKHICGEFTRAAHFVEFRRHVVARRDDEEFWRELRAVTVEYPSVPLALGVAVLATTELAGEFAPRDLTSWTVDRVPEPARLWVQRYGRSSALKSFPGSKLYQLLLQDLQEDLPRRERSLRRILLPFRLPPPVVERSPKETFAGRVRRSLFYLWWIGFRLRFHVVEGIRLLCESQRWKLHKNRMLDGSFVEVWHETKE